MPHALPLWRGAVILSLLLGLLFPLLGASLLAVWVLDTLIWRWVAARRTAPRRVESA